MSRRPHPSKIFQAESKKVEATKIRGHWHANAPTATAPRQVSNLVPTAQLPRGRLCLDTRRGQAGAPRRAPPRCQHRRNASRRRAAAGGARGVASCTARIPLPPLSASCTCSAATAARPAASRTSCAATCGCGGACGDGGACACDCDCDVGGPGAEAAPFGLGLALGVGAAAAPIG